LSYTLDIVKTIIDVPSIAGDLSPDDLDLFMPSSLVGSTYIVDVLFALSFDDEVSGVVPEAITQVVATTPGRTGVSFSVVDSDPFNYTVRVQGAFNEATFVSRYNVVIQGATPNSFVTLTDITTLPEDFLAIFRWTPPSVFWYLFTNSYNFIVNPGDVSEAEVTLNQYTYWNWNAGLATFAADLAKGVI
jgi:hypothetical protein